MLPPKIQSYLIYALSGTPDVVDRMLSEIPGSADTWDARPDSDRFTLREVAAHLADWEPIHLERLTRILEEERPILADIDEAQTAVENDYANSDPHAALAWFRAGREKLMALIASLPHEAWERIGHRERVGDVTIESYCTLILAHDGYHTKQIAQWLSASHS